MVTLKCEEAIVQLIVRSYDEQGNCLGERVVAPTKLFRARTPDPWKDADLAVAQLQKQENAAATKPQGAREKQRRQKAGTK